MVNSNITLISRYALEHFDKIMLLQRDLAHYVFACFCLLLQVKTHVVG